MFCPNCGNRNEELNKWCTTCGYKFDEKPEETENPAADEIPIEIMPEFTLQKTETETVIPESEPQKIKSYLGWSIIAALLGSIIFGIAAVIFAGITKAELAAGDAERAKIYSDHTKFFCLIALSVAIVKFIFIVAMITIFVSMSDMNFLL